MSVWLQQETERGKTKRKLQDQGKEETTQPVSLLHLTPVELWLGSSRQRWVLILSQMAQGPEAKKMTETCYVAYSAWGCGAEWLVSIYKWGFKTDNKVIMRLNQRLERKKITDLCVFTCLVLPISNWKILSQPSLTTSPLLSFHTPHSPEINTCWIKWNMKSLHWWAR